MKKRYLAPFFMMMFLSIGAMQVHAETQKLKSESITLTEENRYNPEYYQEPEARYPAAAKGMSRAAGAGQTVEECIVGALNNFETEIDVSAFQIPSDRETASATFFQILNAHPELFYVRNDVSWFYNSQNIVTKYAVSYTGTPDEIRQQREELETEANKAVSQVDTSLDDYQQALQVHDYLVLNCEYDKERLDAGSVPDISHTAYGSLVNRIAVCDGYADAFSYIMEGKLGISCDVVSSDSMGHAWNMIEIGGKWYHVDATWDDPTWDCIGRVGHSYFLLSDSAISDSSHNHYSWGAEHTADSTNYDGAFWADVRSAICYFNGAWYYSKYQNDGDITKAVKLVKKDGTQLLAGSEDIVYATSCWSAGGNSYYQASYMFLAKAGNKIYFNTPTEIWQAESDGSVKNFYSPEDLGGMQICGFTVRGNEFWYAPQSDLTSNQKQSDIRKFSLPEISGISAEDVRGTYTGQPYTIEVKGTQEGDVVQYVGADGKYQPNQPQMIDAGTYEVQYQVERDGYATFQGKATVTIGQAVPEYELPSGLVGNSGNRLADVALPAGFAWQDSDTVLREAGTHAYPATYTPEDTGNYQTVNLNIEVAVSCPGHEYISEITKEPTETEKGEVTYTCIYCGYAYTEEIDEMPPEITGITAADVTGIYTGQPYTVTVTGLEAGDIIQYALKTSDDAVYAQEQPEMISAGTYEVLYRVARVGYQPFVGSVRVEIARANPQYTVPTNLKGFSGKTLGSIELPEGFLWQTDPATKLDKVGQQKFYVCYRPEDQVNYQMVMGIEVAIEVECPGHEYGYVVTKEPTETEKGLKTYTCKLCGKVYTEEIAMRAPARPAGVSGLKMTKRTTNALSFSWKKVSGVNYRLMLYKGSKVVSTKYVTGNTCTYQKLASAATYTLRVTPYRIVNGQNVYADSTGSAKTATSPAKVKLSKAKRSGSSKVKLTWKKVTGASGYEIFMKTGNGKYKKIKTVGNGKTLSFTKTKLSKKKSYSFQVRAYATVDGKKIYGANSNVKKVK